MFAPIKDKRNSAMKQVIGFGNFRRAGAPEEIRWLADACASKNSSAR
jgi:hypothetical protein